MDRLDSKKLTPELAKEFAIKLLDRFDAELGEKDDSFLSMAGYFVEAFSDISRQEFIDDYTQTIYSTVYPRKGLFDNPWKAICTIAHECIHVTQFDEDIFMPMKYLNNSAERARYEGKAHYGNSYMNWWRFGEWPDNIATSRRVLAYGISEASALTIEAGLDVDRDMTIDGMVLSDVCKVAVEILTEMDLIV